MVNESNLTTTRPTSTTVSPTNASTNIELLRNTFLQSRYYCVYQHTKALNTVLGKFRKVHYNADDLVFAQGVDDRSLFIIEDGNADVYVDKTSGLHTNAPVVVQSLQKGDMLGAMDFIFNQPRSCTIRARTDLTLWKILEEDLEEFVKSDERVAQEIESARWIRGVVRRNALFRGLDQEDTMDKLVHEFQPEVLDPGVTITRQNEEGDKFYIIQSGAVDVFVKKGDRHPVRVAKLGSGDSFGELSLIFETPRTATVVTTEPTTLLSLESKVFNSATDKNCSSRYLKKLFKDYASVVIDGENFMSHRDFEKILRSGVSDKGSSSDTMSSERLTLICEVADKTGSHLITFSEFVLLSWLLEKEDPEYEIAFLFFDKNRNGSISKEEFVTAMTAMSGFAIKDADRYMQGDRLAALFGNDGKGSLSYEEFTSLMKSRELPALVDFFGTLTAHVKLASNEWLHAAIEGGFDERCSIPVTTSKAKDPYRYLLAGAIAGAASRTCVSPLIRLKMLFQVQRHPPKYTGVVQGLKLMFKEDGFRGFFKGNGSNIVRIAPTSAFQFFFFEIFKDSIARFKGSDSAVLTPYERLLAGGFAGVTAATITYPLDFIRARLTVQTGCPLRYRGIWHGLTTVTREEGIMALYRGWWPTAVGVYPYIGIDFAIYETLRPLLPLNESGHPSSLGILAAGAFAGLTSQTIAFPLELVRRRLQVQGFVENSYNYKGGIWDALKRTVQKDGFTGLYRGMVPNYLKAIPSIGISFLAYENLKIMLKIA